MTSQVSGDQTSLNGTAASDALARLSSEEIIVSLVDAGLIGPAAATVTALFERKFEDGGIFAWGIGNEIVRNVAAVQGRLRPDLEGLFTLYRRAAAEFLRAGCDVAAFFDENWEDALRGTCWQLAWIVSRGGLRGLVPSLAGHLASADQEERVTAALLIADAADYVLQPVAPEFGGGIGPGRGPTREVLLDDSPYRLPQRSTLDAPREGDWVECSAFAPQEVSPPSTFLVQAFAHIPDQARDEALRLARQFDPLTDWRAVKTLECKVVRGTQLLFNLTMPGLEVDDPVQRLVWNGTTESVQFGVSVPRSHRPGIVVGTLTVSQDWVPIGHIKFTVKVTRAIMVESKRSSEPISTVGEDARRYESAFVSYASTDRTKVLERVQVLPRFGVRVLQDVLKLEPGERWARSLYRLIDESDIVLLFWSTAAKRSKRVRGEVRYALKRQHGDEFAPPAIGPVIIEGPPVPRPWKEVAYLHFSDRMIYLMEH
jgi:hypothetical protein